MSQQQEMLETLLARIGHSQIADKDARMLDYYVGVDIIDTNEDKSKALALALFRVGPYRIFIPIFYLNGEVKPTDLMFIENNKKFIPFTKDWVTYIINGATKHLSIGSLKEESNVRDNFDNVATGQELQRYWTSPFWSQGAGGYDKISSQEDIREKIVNDLLAHVGKFKTIPFFTKEASNPDNSIIYDVLRSASKESVNALMHMMQDQDFLKTAQKYWDIQKVIRISRSTIAKSAEQIKKVEKEPTSEVEEDPMKILTHQDNIKDNFYRDGYAVIDKHKKPAMIFRDEKTFHNPIECGVYRTIMTDGSLSDIAVIPYQDPKTEISDTCLVIDPDTKMWTITKRCDVWVFGEPDKDALVTFVTGNSQKIGSMSIEVVKPSDDTKTMRIDKRPRYAIFSKDKQGELCVKFVFEPTDLIRSPKKRTIKARAVYGSSYWDYGRELDIVTSSSVDSIALIDDSKDLFNDTPSLWENENYGWGGKHHRGPSTSGREGMDDVLLINDGYPCMKLEKVDEKGTHQLTLGSDANFFHQLLTQGYDHVEVYSDGLDFTINKNVDDTHLLNKKATLEYFVDNLGMGSSDSYLVVDTALERKNKSLKFFVKKSAPSSNFPQTGPYAQRDINNESYLTGGIPVPTVSAIPRAEVLPTTYDEYRMDPTTRADLKQLVHQDISYANEASKTENQDIFDYSVIGSLAKYTNIADKISEYTKVLESALDKLGQILFIFWWKGGDLIDKFGAHELKDMEDLLRNVFKNFGDLLLRLKSKQVVINRHDDL